MIRTTVLAALLFAGPITFASSPETGLTEYKITPVENLILGENIKKVWTVDYSEFEKPVTITLQKVGKYNRFIVRSKFFELVYASCNEGFGVKCIKNSERNVDPKICSSVLNEQQMQNQRILTSNPVSEEQALELIASYLPDLINEEYRHVID